MDLVSHNQLPVAVAPSPSLNGFFVRVAAPWIEIADDMRGLLRSIACDLHVNASLVADFVGTWPTTRTYFSTLKQTDVTSDEMVEDTCVASPVVIVLAPMVAFANAAAAGGPHAGLVLCGFSLPASTISFAAGAVLLYATCAYIEKCKVLDASLAPDLFEYHTKSVTALGLSTSIYALCGLSAFFGSPGLTCHYLLDMVTMPILLSNWAYLSLGKRGRTMKDQLSQLSYAIPLSIGASLAGVVAAASAQSSALILAVGITCVGGAALSLDSLEKGNFNRGKSERLQKLILGSQAAGLLWQEIGVLTVVPPETMLLGFVVIDVGSRIFISKVLSLTAQGEALNVARDALNEAWGDPIGFLLGN